MTAVRLCGPDCPTPDEPHLEPELDWIGDFPIMHGESDRPVPGSSHMLYGFPSCPDMFCLCGHPNYLMCPPNWWGGEGTIMGMEIRRADD